MKKIARLAACIGMPFFLSACTNTVPTAYELPTAHRASPRINAPLLPVGSDDVTIMGRVLSTATPGPVSIERMPVCDAAEAVLGVALSLSFSCSGGGQVGLEVAGGDAEAVLQTFMGAVRRSGGSVTLQGEIVHVVGGGSEAVGVAGPMPVGMPSGEPETVQGVSFFTLDELDLSFERQARTAVARSAALVVQRLPDAGGLADVRDLAGQLGVDVSAVQWGGQLYAIGNAPDVAALAPFLDMSEAVTVPFDVGFVSPDAVEGIAASFPDVSVRYDDVLGTMWLRGHPVDVRAAYGAIRGRVPSNRDLRIEAVFVSSSQADAQRFETDPVLSLASGDVAIASASAALGTARFSAVVTHLSTYSTVNVLSRPSVVTSSGREAEFVSGDRVPVVGSIDEEGRQSVTYEETGIILRVLPVVLPSGMVRLRINVQISGADGVGVLDNPNISTRSISTTIEVTPGDVVKLSGLVDRSNGQGGGRVMGIFPSRNGSRTDSTLSFFVMVDVD